MHFWYFFKNAFVFYFAFFVFNNEDCLYAFLAFFLSAAVSVVDISDIAILSEITNMVKTMILAIDNTPQKTYHIAQYTDSRNQLQPLTHTRRMDGLQPQPPTSVTQNAGWMVSATTT